MRINHVALYVKDIEKVKEFYKKYFHAIENKKYKNVKTGLETYFLSFEGSETKLEIMTSSENVTRPNGQVSNDADMGPGYIHLAISLGTKEKVDELTSKLKNDGYIVLSGPRITGDGYYESCVLDPENNQIELTE